MTTFQPRIEQINEFLIIGEKTETSIQNDNTFHLWNQFIPKIKTIPNRKGDYFVSMQLYDPDFFHIFTPDRKYEKWAAVEVHDLHPAHSHFHQFTIPGGFYAVFTRDGSLESRQVFYHMYTVWLKNSCYELDNRPHFEILDKDYKVNENEKEEVFIPIRKK